MRAIRTLSRIDSTCAARLNKALLALALLFILNTSVQAETAWYSPHDAQNHIGETVWICGVVGSSRYADSSRGSPTYINLGPAFPNHVFTALIWGSDRHKFNQPPERMEGLICVRGAVESYRGVPQIVVTDPSQIQTGNK